MSMDLAHYLRVREDFPVNALESAIAVAKPNIGGGTAFAIPTLLIKAFCIPSGQYVKLEATADGEIVLTKASMKVVVLVDSLRRYQGLGFAPLSVASHATVSRSFRK